MTLGKLAWKNIWFRPLGSFLSVLLLALGIGLISFLLIVNSQLKNKFDNNLAGIDLVIGAKGSPLQMILCNMYHIDAPTGNISLNNAKPFLNPRHPLIEKSIPLSLGDSYKGYRIVGTDTSFLGLYGGEIAEGQIWLKPMEVILGYAVAKNEALKIGDSFYSTHGLQDLEELRHNDGPKFVVKGILDQSFSVLDQLILTATPSVWAVHDDHSHDHDHDHHNDHDHHHHSEISTYEVGNLSKYFDTDKEITALLVKFKGRSYQSLNMARNINENTELMAAAPAIELNRLYSMMGIGMDALEFLAWIIAFVSALSIFISLYQSMLARKYEIAVMRVQGASRSQVFTELIIEGLILGLIGNPGRTVFESIGCLFFG